MKKTLIAIAFAAASVPMMFAQAPANPPANAPVKTATKVKKHSKKSVKKAAPKTETAAPKQ